MIQSLLAKAKAWCNAKHGRASELARVLGVSRQSVSDWFHPERKKLPTAEQALRLQKFLKNPSEKRRHQ
jgi:transcriptional regulator with XRE-family HTH domain